MNNNNTYTDNYDQASEYLRLVIPFLSQHRIPPSPINFQISYDYVSGGNKGLNKAVDELIQQPGGLTEDQLSILYRKYICPDDKTLDSIRQALQQHVVNIRRNLGNSNDDLSEYLNSLNEFSEFLEDTDNPVKLAQEVQKVMDSTRSAEQSQRNFESQVSGMMEEMEALREQLEKAKAESLTDPLTGLANRKAFDDMLDQMITNYAADKSPFSLIIGDIDHFKKFNDTYGHLVGDRVLKYVGNTIKSCIKGKAMAARFGGEEFVLALPETDSQDANKVAQLVREAISQKTLKHKSLGEEYGKITISLGVGEIKNGEGADHLLERTDKALYQAKENGRNRVEIAN